MLQVVRPSAFSVIGSHGKQLDCPCCVVGKIGFVFAVGSGNVMEEIAEVPQFDFVLFANDLASDVAPQVTMIFLYLPGSIHTS